MKPFLTVLVVVLFQVATWSTTAHQELFVIPGDCNGDMEVDIGEVQRSINMYLELQPIGCQVDANTDDVVDIAEVYRVIKMFLGTLLLVDCSATVTDEEQEKVIEIRVHKPCRSGVHSP